MLIPAPETATTGEHQYVRFVMTEAMKLSVGGKQHFAIPWFCRYELIAAQIALYETWSADPASKKWHAEWQHGSRFTVGSINEGVANRTELAVIVKRIA